MKPHQHAMGIAAIMLVVVILQGLLSPPDAEPEDSLPASAEVLPPYRNALYTPQSRQLFSDFDSTPPNTTPATFMGRPCPSLDCANEMAGYHWAQEHGIIELDDCLDSSREFQSGCMMYVGIERQYNI